MSWSKRPGTVVRLSLPGLGGPNTFENRIRTAVELGRLKHNGSLPVVVADNPEWCWVYLGESALPEEDYCWLSNLGDKVGRFLGPDGTIRILRISWFCEVEKPSSE